VKGALDHVPVYKALTKSGMAVGANIVNSVNTLFHLKNGNIVTFRRHGYACTFKQFGLGGRISSITHNDIHSLSSSFFNSLLSSELAF
jgi:hypothetical protein